MALIKEKNLQTQEKLNGPELSYRSVLLLMPSVTFLLTCLCAQLLRPARLLETSCSAAHHAPLSMDFSRQEYWNGLPFPTPEELHDPGIRHTSPVSPALQVDALWLSHWGNPVLKNKNPPLIRFKFIVSPVSSPLLQ